MLTRDDLRALAELESSMQASDPWRVARLERSRAGWRTRLGELCAPFACATFVVGIGVTAFELFSV